MATRVRRKTGMDDAGPACTAEKMFHSRLDMLTSYLRSLTARWNDQDGAVQNGLLGAWLAARRFDRRRAQCFYLFMRNAAEWYAYTTARRESKHIRRRAYPASEAETTEGWLARKVSVQPVVERNLISSEVSSMLNLAMRECLTDRERRAIVCWAEGRSTFRGHPRIRRMVAQASAKLRAWFSERGIDRISAMR